MRKLPPLTALRSFEAAARHLSFVKAAEELSVTPAAISHQVKTLEDYLQISLFERLPRGLRLTDQGTAYVPELSKGFDHLARAAQSLDRDLPRGKLRISAVPTFVTGWLASRISKFAKLYPDIHVEVLSQDRSARFLEDAIDVGIRYGTGNYPGLVSINLLSEEVFPVASPSLLNQGLRLDKLSDLAAFPLLVDIDVAENEPWNSWDTWFRFAGLDLSKQRKFLSFTDYISTETAAKQGAGLMLGRSVPSAQALRDGRLIRPLQVAQPADYSYYINMPRANATVPKVEVFVDWLLAEAGADPTDLAQEAGYEEPMKRAYANLP